MNCSDDAGDGAPLLPGFGPMPRPVKARTRAPESRGQIGAQATALGIGTKADDDVPPVSTPNDDRPVELVRPAILGPGWNPGLADDVLRLAARVLAIGEAAAARRWVDRLVLPRSALFDLEAIRRMVVVIERQAAARRGTLPPVPPAIQYRDLGEIRAITGGGASNHRLMPPVVATAVVRGINDQLRRLAAAGFASPEDRGIPNAPASVRSARSDVSRIAGSAVRVLNQIGLLRGVSRRGQTAHGPMTLDRRLRLVDDALAQLAGVLGCPPWSADELGLLPASLRDAWDHRATADPLPSPFARSLFEWAAHPAPVHPLALSDPDLVREIQCHPDLDYVDRLRAERSRRSAGREGEPSAGDTERPRTANK